MYLQDLIKERWQRMRADFDHYVPAINSTAALYRVEVRDLYSAEMQIAALVDEIWVTIRDEKLAQRVSEYAAEMHDRAAQLDDLLARVDPAAGEHRDEAVHALVQEASDIAEQCGEQVRDVAVVAALQRIIRCLSADYATLAAHAAALGRTDEATQLAEYANRNRVVEDELSELAKTLLASDTAGAHR